MRKLDACKAIIMEDQEVLSPAARVPYYPPGRKVGLRFYCYRCRWQ